MERHNFPEIQPRIASIKDPTYGLSAEQPGGQIQIPLNCESCWQEPTNKAGHVLKTPPISG